nr:DNA circularization N-terminal domain-containing protein [uncultured Neokomagataea sp.]
MSGALSSFGLGSSASILSSIPGMGGVASSALSGLLNTAALGGVTFDMINSREAAGRRVVRVLFPNLAVNQQIFQDFGNLETPMRLTGVIVGDDYVIRAKRMVAALKKPGSTTLVHPWWGRLRVRITEPGEVAFDVHNMRMATFSVSVVRDPGAPNTGNLLQRITDTVSNLLEKADALVDEATLAVQGVLAPLSIPLALAGSVRSFISQSGGVWDSITGSAPQPIQTAIAVPRAALAAGVSVPAVNADTSYANAVTGVLAGMPVAIVNAITDPAQSIVAPADVVMGDDTQVITAAQCGDLLLTAAEQIGALSGTLSDISPNAASVLTLGAAARALIVSQLMSAWVGLTFVSGDDALTARDRYLAALDALIITIENTASSGSAQALTGLWQAARDLKVALIADATVQVGRLPAVLAIDVPSCVSSWALAYAVAGDTKANVQTVFDDVVTRNAVAHPGILGPAAIEVLDL